MPVTVPPADAARYAVPAERLPEQRYRKFRDMGRLGHEFREATP